MAFCLQIYRLLSADCNPEGLQGALLDQWELYLGQRHVVVRQTRGAARAFVSGLINGPKDPSALHWNVFICSVCRATYNWQILFSYLQFFMLFWSHLLSEGLLWKKWRNATNCVEPSLLSLNTDFIYYSQTHMNSLTRSSYASPHKNDVVEKRINSKNK